jgi:outer membrane protein TolC
MWIVRLALRRPYTFVVASILLLLVTPFVLLRTPTDIFPAINIPVVSIIWQYAGLTARDIQQRLNYPEERALTTTVNNIEHIEDSLAAQTLLANQYGAQSDALLAARKQLEIADNRYSDGLTTYLDVATAESTELNIEFAATQLRGQQLVASVTLVKSLGGGWQESREQ